MSNPTRSRGNGVANTNEEDDVVWEIFKFTNRWNRKFFEIFGHDNDDWYHVRNLIITFREDMEELRKKAETQAKETNASISGSTNEVYQLISLYNVFAGVVLTAVATSSTLHCQHLWSPVGLCLFAYAMIIAIAHMKFRSISHLKYWVTNEKLAIKATIDKIEEEFAKCLMPDSENSFGDALTRYELSTFIEKPKGYTQAWNDGWKKSIIVLPLLTVFTAGLIGSFVHILCID